MMMMNVNVSVRTFYINMRLKYATCFAVAVTLRAMTVAVTNLRR